QKLADRHLTNEMISLCMIVRNEEEMLPQCLRSVKGLVDEIIIVDTGSEDKTVEIAESFGARVYHHHWENSFSLHRNQSISYATGDWILIMDADEELVREDHDKLRMATRIPDINVISISVHNKNQHDGEITSFLTSTRMWRRKLNGYYESIVYNELRLPPEEPILHADVRLIHYGYGLRAEKMKTKLERTKTLLQRQLEENPNNPFANFNYSQLLRGISKTPSVELCREIIEHSRRAVANTDPNEKSLRHVHVSALDQMAMAHFFLGEFDKAEECSLRALEIEPTYIDPMFNLGHIFASQRNFPRAIKAFEDYLDFIKDYDIGDEINNYILMHISREAEAYYELGMVYEHTKQDESARESFLKVLEYKQDYLDVRTHLARLYFNQGDYDTARQYARQRVESDETDLAAVYILADLLRREGKLQEACKYLEKIVSIEPEHEAALLALIESQRQLGNQPEAMRWVDHLLKKQPTSYHGLNLKAEILMALEKYPEAIAVYRRLLEAYPDDADTHNNLGNCHFKLGEFQEAITGYAKALTIKPHLEVALRNIGLSYFKLGEADNAVLKLSLYLDYVPDDGEILYLVARIYLDQSKYTEAIRYLERCVTLDPHSAELICRLADCYLKLGHIESARMGYLQAAKLDPGYEPAQIMLGEVEKLLAQKV
ncbi:MAG: tetratricopeptide repeat protein, partial [candidate division Zixibacteria bacterium]|nr:tetratricopeptide repeat protein [candidate division Zixibacteria bacterium]